MTDSRIPELFNRSTEHLCDWLANDHPNLSPIERRDLALVIEDLVAQTKKEEPSAAYVARFGGRGRRGRTSKASDAELLLVRDLIRMFENQAALSDQARNYLLGAHAKRLGYRSRKELNQAIIRAESREA